MVREKSVKVLLTDEEDILLKKVAKLSALSITAFVRNAAIISARKINLEAAQG